jgi:hypothetical protein
MSAFEGEARQTHLMCFLSASYPSEAPCLGPRRTEVARRANRFEAHSIDTRFRIAARKLARYSHLIVASPVLLLIVTGAAVLPCYRPTLGRVRNRKGPGAAK